MDRMNSNSYDHFHYYNQTYQVDGQRTFQPETGQTSSGVAASETSWNYPVLGQSYQDFNVQAQIPFSPGPDWDLQPMAMKDIIHGQIHQQDGQYSFQPEIGQTSAGVPASGPWWSQPTPGQLQPYQDFNIPMQVPPSLGSDLEYIQHPQPMVLEDTIKNDEFLISFNPQPAVAPRRRKPPIKGLPPAKERFLAGLEAFARGVDLKDCSSSLKFGNYIKDDGSMGQKGPGLCKQLTDAEKTLLRQAIIARQKTKPTKAPVEERFLAGLDKYAQGSPLEYCSATLKFSVYVTNSGYLHKDGEDLCARLSQRDQERVNLALFSRREFYSNRMEDKATVEERFLAGLDNYAQGVPLVNCSETIKFKDYVTDQGILLKGGAGLFKKLLPRDQERVNDALLSRRQFYLNRVMETASVEERFLANLDNYAQGVSLGNCSATLRFSLYASDDGKLPPDGQSLYKRLSPEDQNRVEQALATRRRRAAEQISGDLPPFLDTLELYSKGVDLQTCAKQSGLRTKAERYLTPEGGLTAKGELLIENLPPDEQIDVRVLVGLRLQRLNPSAQVPGSPWQLPEIPASMPEMGGMDPTAMVDPMQTETMVGPMQSEAMMAAAWQYTGQTMPGTRGIPSESAEPLIPSYLSEVFGTDFQHQYGPYADQYPERGV
jgi:hypothetical protein